MTNPNSRDRRTMLASTGALAGAIAASSCCLPVLPFVAAAGLAGSSPWLTALRPYLLAGSVVLIAFGFYQGYRAKKCNCRPSWGSRILLWSSTIIIAVTIFFPQALASLLAG